MRKYLYVIMVLALALSACSQKPTDTSTNSAPESEIIPEGSSAREEASETTGTQVHEENHSDDSGESTPHMQGGPGGGRAGGAVDKSSDTYLQSMITEVVPKYELLTFDDPESGSSLQYYLYVPENYDDGEKYPLLQFIPDSSVVGKETEAFLTQGWGGLIWATEEEQEKHPSFIVIPIFTETVVDDDYNHSGQIDTAVRLLNSLAGQYPIDTDRIYTTGQSMGGMTSFYLNIAYPDLFAASLFVGSQWDTSKLDVLEDREFFYIVSAGDPKASAGQTALLELFDNDGAAYSHGEWSAQDDREAQDQAVEKLLAEGHKANFITFTEGTTLLEGQSAMPGAGEHMTSFDYAYKIEAVRDWLYTRSK